MIEKIGGLTFQDGILVATMDAKREIEKRGGIEKMLEDSMKHNAFLQRLAENGERKSNG